jgi:hypothetical protein
LYSDCCCRKQLAGLITSQDVLTSTCQSETGYLPQDAEADKRRQQECILSKMMDLSAQSGEKPLVMILLG